MPGGWIFLHVAVMSLPGLVWFALHQDLVWTVAIGFIGVISAVISMGDAIWRQLEARAATTGAPRPPLGGDGGEG